MSKDRIIDLQKSLRVARTTLEKIAYGHARNPVADAENALDVMRRLEPKQPLHGVVGHGDKQISLQGALNVSLKSLRRS